MQRKYVYLHLELCSMCKYMNKEGKEKEKYASFILSGG